MLEKRTINTFISSANRGTDEEIYNFTVNFPEDLIKCGDGEVIKINVVSFDMVNTMYNINASNSKFIINEYDDVGDLISSTVYQIPDGNYSVHSLRLWFIGAFLNIFKVLYNPAQNTLTFMKEIINDHTYHIQPINCGQCLGLQNDSIYEITTQGLTTSYISLINFNKIILRTQNINYNMNNIENLHKTVSRLHFSDILFWKSKQDIEPFRNIGYSNEDSGNSFNLTLQDKQLTSLKLQLKNEMGDFITDASNYLLVLQISIMDEEKWIKTTILSIASNIRDLYVSFLWIIEKMKFI